MGDAPGMRPYRSLSLAHNSQRDSVNSIEGVDPPAAVHFPSVRLLVSPVVPSSLDGDTHVGAAVEPSDTATFTVTDEPALKSALDPPALPSTLNSACVQPLAMSVRRSLTVAV